MDTKAPRLDRRTFLGSAAALAALTGARGWTDSVAAAPTPIVHTGNGPVRGLMEHGGIFAFKGVRYAAPPTGALRFLPPRPPARWTEVMEAQRFGAAAIQASGQPDAPPDETYSEDCLFLNVWTAGLDQPQRPVMVWLHGGGFSMGAAGRPTYYGDHFARSGVVLVSVNHRLNVFGFTQLPESWGPAYASSGLAGMLDIAQALRWVRENIAQFGGDPNNVTIFVGPAMAPRAWRRKCILPGLHSRRREIPRRRPPRSGPATTRRDTMIFNLRSRVESVPLGQLRQLMLP